MKLRMKEELAMDYTHTKSVIHNEYNAYIAGFDKALEMAADLLDNYPVTSENEFELVDVFNKISALSNK